VATRVNLEEFHVTFSKLAARSSYNPVPRHMVAIEECAELTVALCHLERRRVDNDAVAEEIADVVIAMEALSRTIDAMRNAHPETEHWLRIKLAKLEAGHR
jgi:hypothetical protein